MNVKIKKTLKICIAIKMNSAKVIAWPKFIHSSIGSWQISISQSSKPFVITQTNRLKKQTYSEGNVASTGLPIKIQHSGYSLGLSLHKTYQI